MDISTLRGVQCIQVAWPESPYTKTYPLSREPLRCLQGPGSVSRSGVDPVLAEQFAAFLFDLDGVVYVGEKVLPGARDSLARLREMGKPVRFLTNDPRPTRDDVAQHLAEMGVEVRTKEVVTSGWATAKHLRESGMRSAYVVGSEGLAAEVRELGVEVVGLGRDCDAVVVGCDERVSYRHIRRASELVHGGARFVATNGDGSFPGPEGPLPATGAIVAAIRAATGKRPTVVGKPHPRMFDLCAEDLGIEASSSVAVIGDSPETDILGAHNSGFAGILVSSRPDVFASPRDYRVPDATIADLRGLFEPELTARRWKRPAFPWPEKVKAGVAGVVFDWSNRVLLVRRMDNGLWGLPSGHVELGEAVEEAIRREVSEEAGLEVDVLRLIGVYSDPESQAFSYPSGEVSQFVTSCFLCEISGGELHADRVEVLDAAFFPANALPEDLLPMHPRWLSDALAGKISAFVR